MSDAFESIMRGANEALEHSKGSKTEVRVFVPSEVDVKSIRTSTGLSQPRFASTVGISVKTLRHWEQGDRKPQGAALVLLNALSRDYKKFIEVLNSPLPNQ